eukprot:SAG31_NODE_5382_length_2572_cov_64.320259_2_plen_526_part_00
MRLPGEQQPPSGPRALALLATLVLAIRPTSAARHPPLAPSARSAGGAAHVARTAADLSSALLVEEALHAVTMPASAARRAGKALSKVGFVTALDLELLGGGQAAAEVLAELKAAGLGPADRAKVRLLVGDREHLRRLLADGPTPLASSDLGSHSRAANRNAGHSNHSNDPEDQTRASRQISDRGRRKLQHTSTSEMSVDTIAIVVSVLVGAAGYALQAHTARRAERAQEQQAQELHGAEQARQREHQMMTAQIERTHQALDRCCRPALDEIQTLTVSRVFIVWEIVGRLEVSHPDAVKEMMSFANGVASELRSDGTVVSCSSGNLYWTSKPPPELTRALAEHRFGAPTGAAEVISQHDTFVSVSQPYCFEMPSAILDIINAEPTGEIAELYRGYIRHVLMPLARRITDTLREYAAYLELPTKDWLQKMFPKMGWRNYSNSRFFQTWLTHTECFERVMAEWTVGNFASTRAGAPLPISGLMQTLVWCQERSENRQIELIGMTSVNELKSDNVHIFSRLEGGSADPE